MQGLVRDLGSFSHFLRSCFPYRQIRIGTSTFYHGKMRGNYRLVTEGLGTDEVSVVNSTFSRQDSESSSVLPEPDTDEQQSVKCSLLYPLPPSPKLSRAIHYKGLFCLAHRTALGARSGGTDGETLDSNPAESSTRTSTLSRPPAQHAAVQHNRRAH